MTLAELKSEILCIEISIIILTKVKNSRDNNLTCLINSLYLAVGANMYLSKV